MLMIYFTKPDVINQEWILLRIIQSMYLLNLRIEKALLKVVGMYCTTCKPIVEKQLKDEEAVNKIDIDYMTYSVVVEFDPSLITKEGKGK
jgi:copper chaperone